MSLINGPKKVLPTPPSTQPPAVGAMAGAGAMAILQKLAGIRFDPAPTYLFFVELSGSAVACFTEVSGMGAVRAIEKVSEGGRNDHSHVLPGKVEYPNIILKRGLSLSR
ncbi:MAG: phage tail protein, partial [Anaerolineaceae bacterium]